VPDHGYLYDLLLKLGLTEFAASTGEFVLGRPLKIVFILVLAMLVSRFGGRALRRAVRSVRARTPMSPTAVRAEQRASTLGDVLASSLRAVVWAIATLMILQVVGLNLAPLLAGAGIAGIAIGFGAQSLVKDVISGVFILLEDQYGVGDVVTLEGATGTVEDVTVRVTRVRSTDGTVWFVPNGEIRKVGNSSMEWSRAVVDVLVPYEADLDAVRQALTEEAHAMATDADWQGKLLEPPEVWGVQALDPSTVTLRMVVKTAPAEQYGVARELRGRVTSRLRRDGVRGPAAAVAVAGAPTARSRRAPAAPS
jgi:small conductance mechanosensitive channel